MQLTSLLARPARWRKDRVTSVLVSFPVAIWWRSFSAGDSVISMTFFGSKFAGRDVRLSGRPVGRSGIGG
jgi:hypothetical protein